MFEIFALCIPLLTWRFAVQLRFLNNGQNTEDNKGGASTQDERFECGALGTEDGFLVEWYYDNRAAIQQNSYPRKNGMEE